VPVATKLAPIIDFFSSASLSLLARNPGSELALTCVDGCSASVTGKIAVAERHGKHKALRHLTLQLAPQPLTLAADGSTLYDLALTGSQRSTLSKATSATLTLTVSAKDDSTGQTVTDSKSFTLTRT
jgi:VCBS repeat-containing protein